jgi:glycosyltransferase involved in cell wall biosynthesis
MRKILYISYIYPPMTAGGVFRSAQFTKYLVEFGWSPTVLTTSLPRRAQIDRKMLIDLPKEVAIVRAMSLERLFGQIRGAKFKGINESYGFIHFLKHIVRILLFPDRQLLWLPGALLKGILLSIKNRYELFFASYGPATNLLIGYILKKIFNKPLVVDFRDLWVDDPTDMAPTRLHHYLYQLVEKKIVSAADRIVTVVDYLSEHYKTKYNLDDRQVITITNGFDPKEQRYYRDISGYSHEKLTILYTGSVYGYRSPANFFQAIEELIADRVVDGKDMEIEFIGNLDNIVANNYNLDKIVKTSGFIPHKQVIKSLAEADVLLLIISKLHKHIAYTGKVFEYLMTGKPILALTAKDSIVADLLRKAEVGFIVDPDDITEIKNMVSGLYAKWKNRSLHVLPNWPVINQFDRRKLTKNLARVFSQLVEVY